MSQTPDAEPTRIAICAVARNEGPYIAEWVAYHRLLGFDHIVVYDNESTDETPEVLASLEEQGWLRARPWQAPPDAHAQRLAYKDGLRRLRKGFAWVAMIDLDEFIVLPQHDTIHDFVADFESFDAIAMNWKVFGTSGCHEREPGLVIERFQRCAKLAHSGNHNVKTLARPRTIQKPNVHNHKFRPDVTYRTVLGEEIPEDVGKSRLVSHDVIRVNHYFTKSREEWDAKVARGRATKPSGHPEKFRTERHFEMHDRNEDQEHDILRLVPQVKQMLSHLSS
jgi:glycosyltransferase involved in cell wall biosynthesis